MSEVPAEIIDGIKAFLMSIWKAIILEDEYLNMWESNAVKWVNVYYTQKRFEKTLAKKYDEVEV